MINAFNLVALREIICSDRTLFILDCFRDEGLGRCVQAGLNKGEISNALARAVFMHRLSEIRDRGAGESELQRHRVDATYGGDNTLEYDLYRKRH